MDDDPNEAGFTQCDMQEAYDRGVQQASADADQAHMSGFWRGLLAGIGLGGAFMMLVEMLR